MTTSEAGAVRTGSATEHELLAEARLRVDLLGEVTSALTGSLNLRRTVLRLLDLITPRVADWAMVVLVDDTSGLTLHGGADPTFATAIPRALIEGTGVERVLRSG
ncbi:MAG TPA: serine/threonine protein phosphatase, partial [Umezawaea sp.]|nr:serine/threonine protein phosphatase [Umezawaea sp.]